MSLPELESRSQSVVNTTIGEDGLTGNVRSTFRGQPENHIGDFLWFAQAAYRSVCCPALANHLLRGTCGQRTHTGQFLEAFRSGVTRSNVVDQNAVFAEFVGQALYQPDHGSSHRVGEHQ